VLDAAYEWLCRRRREYSANADVWSKRRPNNGGNGATLGGGLNACQPCIVRSAEDVHLGMECTRS
jgi:hypothetical protein